MGHGESRQEATRPGIEIRPLATPGEMQACTALQQEVWGLPELEVVPVVELVSAAKAAGCVAGAFEGPEMVGFIYGIWGLENERPYHYSRMLGVKPGFRGKGLGRLLKFFQRDFVLARGVNLMRWTFDPLEGPNASLNFKKLGVVADEYIVDYYGFKGDDLNRGLPTDRFFVKWFLDDERVKDLSEGFGNGPSLADILTAGPPALSSRPRHADLPHPAPQTFPAETQRLHIEIPPDIQTVKRKDIELASAWRLAVRDAALRAFAAGFRAEAFARGEHEGRRRSAYLLVKRS